MLALVILTEKLSRAARTRPSPSSISGCQHFLQFSIPFSEPNDESAANVDAAKTWRDDRQKFNDIAERTVRKTLGL